MSFISELIKWYQINKRDLPWRNTTNPYIIWLSEIILQQTRVNQGLPYYNRFVSQYPGISDFAAATEDEILNLWQGLGYYSRGRNMHRTALMVMEKYNGYFPSSYDDLITLKGVGEYTAAAIASFSANEAKAVVDGNVFRVLARYFGIKDPINTSGAKKLFTRIANELIDKRYPAISNQAIMEFGALHCKPVKPLCDTCPLKLDCVAFHRKEVTKYPVKLVRAPIKHRYFNYIVVSIEGRVIMRKRLFDDIWKNMYEFPLVESEESLNLEQLRERAEFIDGFGSSEIIRVDGPVKHLLSHQAIHAKFFIIDGSTMRQSIDPAWFFADIDELERLAQPKLIFTFLKNFLN